MPRGAQWPELASWLALVSEGVAEAGRRFPFLAYGTDWLAFGHFVIALAFVGPWRDPIRNAWVVDFGLAACGLVIPFALVNMRIETGPVTLSEDYLRMVEEVESAPENGAGTGKTWVEKAQREFREYFARVAREN